MARLILILFGLALAFLVFCACGVVGLFVDADHVVAFVQNCGWPPTLFTILTCPGGRPYHAAAVWVAGYLSVCGVSLYTGLLLGAVHTPGVQVEGDVMQKLYLVPIEWNGNRRGQRNERYHG